MIARATAVGLRSSLPRAILLPATIRPVAYPIVQTQRHHTTKLHSDNPDWAAPIITYEELKPRTEEPSVVCTIRTHVMVFLTMCLCLGCIPT